MTTDATPHRRRPGNVAVPVATAVVAMTAAASVSWAAATPVHPATAAPAAPTPVDTSKAQQELAALQRSLVAVRRDLLELQSMHLPQAHAPVATTGAAGGSGGTVGSAYVPPAPAPVAAAPAPATHTCTGASGAPC